jgi:hypothetical protein
MHRTHREGVLLGKFGHRPFDRCHLHVDGPAAALADQMMMGKVIAERAVTEMDHPGTVPQMSVVEETLFLQGVDAPVDGRGDNVSADALIDPIQQGGGSEVIQVGFSQYLANRPASFGDPQSRSP